MIESERLIFREMTENDFETIAKIMRDEGVQKILFNTLNAPKIVCDIRPMNQSSIAVAKRLGMLETGMFVKHYRGKEMPHLIFELYHK